MLILKETAAKDMNVYLISFMDNVIDQSPTDMSARIVLLERTVFIFDTHVDI